MSKANRLKGNMPVPIFAAGVLALLLCLAHHSAGQPNSKAVRSAEPAKPGVETPAAADGTQPAPANAGPATTRPQTPKGAFELIEWVVFVVDPNRTNVNDLSSFKSTMPGFARGRRQAPVASSIATAGGAPASAGSTADLLKDPSPVGVIRLVAPASGNPAEEEPIDVLLQVSAGKFHASWPPGKPKQNRLLWEKVTFGPGKSVPVPADAGSWFETLRRDDARDGKAVASPLSASRWSERFLMYDAELSYPNVLRVKAAAGQPAGAAYQLANAGSAAMREVQVYAPAEGGAGWRVAGLAEVPNVRPKASKAATTVGGPAPDAPEGPAVVPDGPAADALKQVFSEISSQVKPIDVKVEAKPAEGGTAATQAATTQPASRPTTGPATTKPSTQPAAAEDIPKDLWRDVKIDTTSKPQVAADAVDPWRKRLTDAGLTASDVDIILATLRTHALDAEQLTVVYQMDPDELDRLLPLEVVPMPAKTTRIGLAIVRNIDPAAGERVAKLVAQLGDPDWDRREAAQAKLADMGAGAKPKLTEALKNPDVEIVYRAERLLEAINNPQ